MQSPLATAPIERRLSEQDPGFVSIVAMLEMARVLQRPYGRSAGEEIAAPIERVPQAEILVVEDEQKVFTPMIILRQGPRLVCRRPDCGTWRQGGCSHTVAFDRKALRLPGFAAAALGGEPTFRFRTLIQG